MMDGSNEWADLPPVEDVNAADVQAEIKRLAGLSAASYEGERRVVATRMGWCATVLDAEVQRARPCSPEDGPSGNDDASGIETLEPWADPVDGALLAEEIRDRLRAHVVFGATGDADCAALWIFGTYLMDCWRLWPRLLVTSPTKACGKSTLLEVLDAMVRRGFIASNASPAAVFRAIEAWRPTLLLDEADTWAKQNDELQGILNSGHTRRTARVIRVQEVNGEHLPVAFSTWCAMAIAGIGGQRDTLMSRSIVISLRRKLPEETVDRLSVDLHSHLLRIRRQLARWAADNAVNISGMEIEPPTCGNDRRQDNFTPLWRIAATLGGAWPDRIAAAYAAQAQAEDDDSEPAGVMMLRDIADLFAARDSDRIASAEIVSELMQLEDRPWMEWRHGKPISAQSVARLMKPFGIQATVKKLGGISTRVYLRSEVDAAAARYTASTRNAVTMQQNQQVTANSNCSLEPKVTRADDHNSLDSNGGYAVTPETPQAPELDIWHPVSWR